MLKGYTKTTASSCNDYSEGKLKIRPTNIGDMLITDEEITELFLDGKRELLFYFFTKGDLKPIVTETNNSPSYILREVISIFKKLYKNKKQI